MKIEITVTNCVDGVYGRKETTLAGRKCESDSVRLVQQFAHAMRWAGDDSERLRRLRSAIKHAVQEKFVPSILQQQIDKVVSFLDAYGGGQPGFRAKDIPVPHGDPSRLLLTVNLPDKNGEPGWLRTFRDWWEFDCGLRGDNRLMLGFEFDVNYLRLAPGVEYRPGIRWVEYEPNVYAGEPPKHALQLAKEAGLVLAGAESLMASVLLDGYVESWNANDNYAPNLTTYQLKWVGAEEEWSFIPCLSRVGKTLELIACVSGDGSPFLCSPCIKEC